MRDTPELSERPVQAKYGPPAGPRCGAWMKINREPCARSAGHRNWHLSRGAMDVKVIRMRRPEAARMRV